MNNVIPFFVNFSNTSIYNEGWNFLQVATLHGRLYLTGNFLVCLAYIVFPVIILKCITKKYWGRFLYLFFLLTAFITACASSHFFAALISWMPFYYLKGPFRFIAAAGSWFSLLFLIRYLPAVFAKKWNNVQEEDTWPDETGNEHQEDTVNSFQSMMEGLEECAIVLVSAESKVIQWSKGTGQIARCTKEEVKQEKIEVLYSAQNTTQKEWWQDSEKVIQTTHIISGDLRVRRDGSIFYADIIHTKLYDKTGRLCGYFKMVKNIMEKRKTEIYIRFLATIAENIQDPIISADNDNIITGWNSAAEKLLEWKSEEVIGKLSSQVLNIFYPRESNTEILIAYQKNSYWQGELIYHTRSGRPVYIAATNFLLKDASGNATANVSVIKALKQEIKKTGAGFVKRLMEIVTHTY